MERDWITYKKEQEKARVLVDRTLKHHLDTKLYPFLLTLSINIYRIAETAEQAREVQTRIQTLHDEVETLMGADGHGVWIGRIQSSSRLELFFYVPEPDAATEAVKRCLAGYPEFRTTVATREDAAWQLYEYLLPSALETQLAYNSSGLSSLLREGYRIGRKDRVLYHLRFPSQDALKSLCRQVEPQGYRVENIDYDPSAVHYPHVLLLSIQCPLDEEALDRNTTVLVEAAARAGGKYDWWNVVPKATTLRMWKEWLSRMKLAAWFAVFLILISIISLFLFDLSPTKSASAVEKPLAERKPAPGFKLQDEHGTTVAFGKTGRPTVINFCDAIFQPCQQDYMQMQSVAAKYKDRVDFYTIRRVRANAPLYTEHPSVYPMLIDEKGEMYRKYHARTFPITYIVDTEGVVFRVIGPGRSLSQEEVQDFLEHRL